jgi:hypothetical protein
MLLVFVTLGKSKIIWQNYIVATETASIFHLLRKPITIRYELCLCRSGFLFQKKHGRTYSLFLPLSRYVGVASKR